MQAVKLFSGCTVPYAVHTHAQARRYTEHMNNVFKFKYIKYNEANWFELTKLGSSGQRLL